MPSKQVLSLGSKAFTTVWFNVKVLSVGVSSVDVLDKVVVKSNLSPPFTAGVSVGPFTFTVTVISLVSKGFKSVKLHDKLFTV